MEVVQNENLFGLKGPWGYGGCFVAYPVEVYTDTDDPDGPPLEFIDVKERKRMRPDEARTFAYAILRAADYADPPPEEETCPFGRSAEMGCCCPECQPWLT